MEGGLGVAPTVGGAPGNPAAASWAGQLLRPLQLSVAGVAEAEAIPAKIAIMKSFGIWWILLS